MRVDPVAPVGHGVRIGGRGRRAPRQHGPDPTDHGGAAPPPVLPQVDGQRCGVAEAAVGQLGVVVGVDLHRAEVGEGALVAEVGPVGDELVATGGARPTREAVRPLDPEAGHELLGVVVQADALELLVGGVPAGALQVLPERGQVDRDGLGLLRCRDEGMQAHRSLVRCRRQEVGQGEAVIRDRLVAPGLGVQRGHLDQRQRRQRARVRDRGGQLLQDVRRQLEDHLVRQVPDDVLEDEPAGLHLHVALVHVPPDRRLVRLVRGRHDLPGQDDPQQRQYGPTAPAAPGVHVDAAHVGQWRPGVALAGPAAGEVVHVDARKPLVHPARSAVVAQEEAHVLEGPLAAQPTAVARAPADLDRGLEPVALRTERGAGEPLVGGVALLGELDREVQLGERAEVVRVRRQQRVELAALPFHVALSWRLLGRRPGRCGHGLLLDSSGPCIR